MFGFIFGVLPIFCILLWLSFADFTACLIGIPDGLAQFQLFSIEVLRRCDTQVLIRLPGIRQLCCTCAVVFAHARERFLVMIASPIHAVDAVVLRSVVAYRCGHVRPEIEMHTLLWVLGASLRADAKTAHIFAVSREGD